MKLSRKKIYALAAFWDKDYRTILRWLKNENAFLTHPDSQKIIKSK